MSKLTSKLKSEELKNSEKITEHRVTKTCVLSVGVPTSNSEPVDRIHKVVYENCVITGQHK